MPRPTEAQRLVMKARRGEPGPRVEVPRTVCSRCQQEGYALPDGTPRPHLRPAVQGDPGWSEIVPVRVSCEDD
jgi:hypothetical protein